MNYAELESYSNLLVGKNLILGEFASWAVQQSPYVCPEGLEVAVIKLHGRLPFETDFPTIESLSTLRNIIYHAIITIPEVEAWNNRKNGREGMGFASRYGQPSPDDDFIDLDALARNIAKDVWQDAVEFKISNDEFDRKYNPNKVTTEGPQ